MVSSPAFLPPNGTFACEALVFAVGHSARDTFGMLMDGGLQLECKPFSVGFRAEHLQSEIEKSLYHEAAGHPALPRGEYQLSQHVGGSGAFTPSACARRAGGGIGQRGRPCSDQRHELSRPQWQKCQRGRGGERGRQGFCRRSAPGHRVPAGTGSQSLRRWAQCRGVCRSGREHPELSERARPAEHWTRAAYL